MTRPSSREGPGCRIRSRGREISAKRKDIFCDISVVVAGVGRWDRGEAGDLVPGEPEAGHLMKVSTEGR